MATRKVLIAIAIAIPLLLIGLVTAQPRVRAALRLTAGFVPMEEDNRIYYEAGAEAMANALAKALPAAVARIEEYQSLPFESGYRIYVCSSHSSFTQRIGVPLSWTVRGIAFPRTIWISPLAFAFHGQDTHQQSLTHELCHLHFAQHLGWWKRTKNIPIWFAEGLAGWLADTGGEIVSRAEALESFRSGRHMVPEAAGKLRLRPPTLQDIGISFPMFHMQSRMFVEYLFGRGEEPLKNLITALMNGARFNVAFEDQIGDKLENVWQEFLHSMNTNTVYDTPES
jgi:hypothetical protein